MKILKRLSSFFFVFLVCNPINDIKANEPVDIWNIEKKEIPEDQSIIQNKKEDSTDVIQGIKIEQQNEKILVNNSLSVSDIKLAGLYLSLIHI